MGCTPYGMMCERVGWHSVQSILGFKICSSRGATPVQVYIVFVHCSDRLLIPSTDVATCFGGVAARAYLQQLSAVPVENRMITML